MAVQIKEQPVVTSAPTDRALGHHAWRIERMRLLMDAMHVCFCKHPYVSQQQCQVAVAKLRMLRRFVNQAEYHIAMLEYSELKRLQPFDCITLLASFDMQLTELIVALAILELLCETSPKECIGQRRYIRALFNRLMPSYNGVIAQLSALAKKAVRP